jgi:hypothetical protein
MAHLATVILLEAVPAAFQNIGCKFWMVLIILTEIYGVLVYLYQREPKGLPFEDVSVLFGIPPSSALSRRSVKSKKE